MNPSEPCSDEVFLRRAYLDLLGILPKVQRAQQMAGAWVERGAVGAAHGVSRRGTLQVTTRTLTTRPGPVNSKPDRHASC